MTERVEREFRRNKRLHGKRIHCRRGCTDCCHHIFQISEIEAASISRCVKSLPAQQREQLVEKAQVYLPARDALMKDHGYIQAWGSLPRPETRLACPALNGGVCTIYEHRPLLCRQYGMPLFHPQQPHRLFACELNFHPGEQIADNRLVGIQSGIAAQWEQVKDDYYRKGGRRRDFPISVAHAIIEDFEGYLPE